MSKFQLGGVPSHAYDLFYKLRDAVQGPEGPKWSAGLAALLATGDPKVAILRLEQPENAGVD